MRVGRRGIAILAGAVVAGSLSAATAVPALATTVVEYQAAGSGPNGIVTGSDGALWFTDAGHNSIDRVTADGHVTNQYPIPTTNSVPTDITGPLPDGSLWFLEMNGITVNIGKVSVTGAINEYSSGSGRTSGIAIGSDGNIWFGDVDHFAVAKMDPVTHVVTDYWIPPGTSANPNNGAYPVQITAGPDANLWVVDEPENTIWKVTTGGNFTGYQFSGTHRGFNSITVGADNNLWIGEPSANLIGRMTIAGALTEYPIPTAAAGVGGIGLGPDGNVWFTENNANKIAVITPAGAITEFPIPTGNSLPRRPAAGPDGHVWFPENVGNIAKVVVGNTAAPAWWDNRNLTTTVPKPNGPWYRQAASSLAHALPASSRTFLPHQVPASPGSASAGPARRPDDTVSSTLAGLGEGIVSRLRAILS